MSGVELCLVGLVCLSSVSGLISSPIVWLLYSSESRAPGTPGGHVSRHVTAQVVGLVCLHYCSRPSVFTVVGLVCLH